MIYREHYIKPVRDFYESDLIKIITGIRRCGKSVILEQRRKEAFDDVYSEFLTTLSSEFNEKVWKDVQVEVKKDVKTDRFFEVYEKYCDW